MLAIVRERRFLVHRIDKLKMSAELLACWANYLGDHNIAIIEELSVILPKLKS